MVCANASREHKGKIEVIGKSKKPRCFKTVQTLRFIHVSEKCLDDFVIFLDWFKNEFIPSVTKFREETSGKVLLIIDIRLSKY